MVASHGGTGKNARTNKDTKNTENYRHIQRNSDENESLTSPHGGTGQKMSAMADGAGSDTTDHGSLDTEAHTMTNAIINSTTDTTANIDKFDEETFRSMFNLANEAIFVFPLGYDGKPGSYVAVNPIACELLGYTESELLQLSPVDITPQPRHSGIPNLLTQLDEEHKIRFEGAYVKKTGEVVPLEFNATKLKAKEQVLVVSFARDISTEKAALEQLRESEEMYRTLVETSPLLITVIVDERVVFVNKMGAQIMGGNSPDELVGRSMWDFLAEEEHEGLRRRIRSLTPEQRINPPIETRMVGLDGRKLDVESRTSLIQYGNRPAILAVIQDTTERKRSQMLIRNMAYRDQLTNLFNRRAFVEQLQKDIRKTAMNEPGRQKYDPQSNEPQKRAEAGLALLFLDIDRFKVINDTFGHAAGDQLLSQVADRLREVTPPSSFIARLGGDEFTILVRQPMEKMCQLPHDIIIGLNRYPFRVQGQEILVTASLGATQFSASDDMDVDLLRQADVAMYEAKRQGGNSVSWYHPPSPSEFPIRRLQLETGISQALNRGEFSLVYQPKVYTKTGEIAGLEALIRWHSPEFGQIAPAEFIPITEENGLIIPLGHWVIQEVCNQLEKWRNAGLASVPIAINLSPRQFRSEDFYSVVQETLAECDLCGSLLEFEITERSLMDNTASTAHRMQQLRDLGVSFSIDDFGVGYSSLAYLKRFPIDVLKIDQSFVKDLETDPNNRQIVIAMIQLAHNLGLKVTAEGVEQESHRRFFQYHGCDMMQGYLIATPQPPEAIESWLLA